MFRYDRRISSLGFSSLCSLGLFILISLSTALLDGHAQARRDPVGGAGSSEARRSTMRALDNDRPDRPTERRVPFERMKEDFEQLQLTNTRLFETTRSASALDYVQVKRDSTEIEKRAARLRKDLLLPEPEKRENHKEGTEFPPADLIAALGALDSAVRRFVENPVFQQPHLVDAKLWSQASNECDRVIELSKQVQKIAKLLLTR